MSATFIIDQYYLTITFLISLAMQGTAFIISYSLQTDKLTDLMGSLNFFVLALFTLLVGGAGQRGIGRSLVTSIFVLIWSSRLGGFLFFRVLKTGKDGRFDEMRSKFWNFGAFWLFQLFWCWIVSMPVTILNSPSVSNPNNVIIPFGTSRDIVGTIMWGIGFLIEVVADQQKYNYKSNRPPRGSIFNVGVWNWTRHPNFFGEILLWWGIWTICIEPAVAGVISPSATSALYGSVVSPIFITLLLFFVSGLPLAEKPSSKKYFLMAHGARPLEGKDRWEEYKEYLNSTSIFIPIPPTFYRPIPTIIKRTILFDWPMFAFDAEKEGPATVEEERKNDEGREA